MWLLPMASGLVFLWSIELDGWKFKLMVLVSTALWIPYDLFFLNYTAVAFDVFGVAFNAITAWRITRGDRQESDAGDESVGDDAEDGKTEKED